MNIYRNIGVLNLTKAGDDVLKDMKELRNIGSLILSKNQQAALGNVSMVNVGDRITVEDGEKIRFTLRNGEVDIKDEMLKGQQEKSYFLVNGRMYLKDLSEEAAENIAGISINGEIFGPEKSYGLIANRIRINGRAATYPEGYEFIKGDLTLKEENMVGFSGEEALAVNKLIALEPIPEGFLKEGKSSYFVLGEIIATRETLSAIAPFVKNIRDVEKTLVPEGYRYFERLTLKEENLFSFSKDKLFVKEELTVKVPLSMLEGRVEKIITKSLKILEGDRELVPHYVEKAEEVSTINPNAFENYSNLLVDEGFLQRKKGAEIRNYGVLEFDAGISRELLEEGLKALENYGKILCSKEQRGLILQKMTENCGVVNVPEEEEERPVTEGTVVENVGVLEL